MKKIILFLYVLANTLFAQTFDFFPLGIGTKYTYSYYNYDSEWYYPHIGSGYTWFEKDSGLVYYTIVDSVQIDDSLIIWTIEERDSLLHKYYYSGWDTIYWNLNISQHNLTENINSAHKLSAQMNIWILNSDVFRFSSDTSEILEFTIYEYFYPGTIKLQKNIGLISVYKDIHFSGITSGQTHLKEATLLNRTITFILPDQSKKLYGFDLTQNYPNPFNPITKIIYSISQFGFVTLKIFDVLGKEVATLVSEEKPNGNYEVSFNASNLASGIYYYQLRAGDFVETKKMILLK